MGDTNSLGDANSRTDTIFEKLHDFVFVRLHDFFAFIFIFLCFFWFELTFFLDREGNFYVMRVW